MHGFGRRIHSGGAAAVCLAALVCGCGQQRSALPNACGAGGDALLGPLRAAPGTVHLGKGRLSDCLRRNATGDELQLVGTSFVDAASRLSERDRRRPRGRAALELGYLVAAAHRGGAHTQGIHEELLRRLDQELETVDTRSRAYRRGKRAGQAAG